MTGSGWSRMTETGTTRSKKKKYPREEEGKYMEIAWLFRQLLKTIRQAARRHSEG